MTNFENLGLMGIAEMLSKSCVACPIGKKRCGDYDTQSCKEAIITWFEEEEEIALKPCPFCGATGEKVHYTELELKNDDTISNVSVICDYQRGGCGAVSGYDRSEELAAKKWNRRTS